MKSEWRKCRLSDLGTIVGGATPPTRDSSNYEGGTIPWITPKDLSSFKCRYITNGERNITMAGLCSCSTQMLPENTVLFSSRAPIGYVAMAKNKLCTNQGFKSIVPFTKTDPLFLYYLTLLCWSVKLKLQSCASSKQKHMNFKKMIRLISQLRPISIVELPIKNQRDNYQRTP